MTGGLVTLVEDGPPAVVDASRWATPGLSDIARELDRRKIIRLHRVGDYHVITPTRYVGRAAVSRTGVEVVSKAPELFAEILRVVRRLSGRTAALPDRVAPATDDRDADASMLFLHALRRVVDVGVPFDYVFETVDSGRPTGRLNASATIRRHRSRGVSHRVVCSVPHQRPWEGVDTVVATTAAYLQRDHALLPSALTSLRAHADYLGGTEAEPGRAIGEAERLLLRADDEPELSGLLRAAVAVLRGDDRVWDAFEMSSGARASFCMVQNAWEEAVALLLGAGSAGWTYKRHPYASTPLPFLGDGGPNMDPDIIGYDGDAARAVLDAKYKVATGPVASDVYQAACYGDVLGLTLSVLVYVAPGEGWSRELEATDSGTTVWAVGLPQSGLVEEGARLASRVEAFVTPS